MQLSMKIELSKRLHESNMSEKEHMLKSISKVQDKKRGLIFKMKDKLSLNRSSSMENRGMALDFEEGDFSLLSPRSGQESSERKQALIKQLEVYQRKARKHLKHLIRENTEINKRKHRLVVTYIEKMQTIDKIFSKITDQSAGVNHENIIDDFLMFHEKNKEMNAKLLNIENTIDQHTHLSKKLKTNIVKNLKVSSQITSNMETEEKKHRDDIGMVDDQLTG